MGEEGQSVETGGGTHIKGGVHLKGGDFVAQDKVIQNIVGATNCLKAVVHHVSGSTQKDVCRTGVVCKPIAIQVGTINTVCH